MDSGKKSRNNKYDRVMSRVHNISRTSLKSSSFVTRHDIPSSVRVGAKSIASNVSSSGVINELPTFLNDYVPESSHEKVKRTYVVKPRKTIKSLDLSASPPRIKQRDLVKKSSNIRLQESAPSSNIRLQESAPSVLNSNGAKWSATHLKECLSSRSHSRLKDLKDEIKAYKETEKLMRLRSSLFKKCGVVLDDVGNMAEDKAVQAELVGKATDATGQTTMRYPNEYAAPPESILMTEDLSDDMYESLLDERPDLEPILAPLRKKKNQHPKTSYSSKTTTVSVREPSVYHEFEFPRVYHRNDADDEGEEEYTMSATAQYANQPKRLGTNTPDSTAAARSSLMLPFIMRNQTHNDTTKSFSQGCLSDEPPWDESPIVATCYTCGHTTTNIPVSSLCHDLFDSQDWRARTLRRFFRSSCHYNWKWRNSGATRKTKYYWYDYVYDRDMGLKTGRLAGHLPGCFKRFLDIGTVYTARGCRKWWPDSSGGLAGNRFLSLEHLLRRYKDQCIISPHASLTPFSRGISLFARYHVCPGRYCDRATVSKALS